jgi:hypothetical protein
VIASVLLDPGAIDSTPVVFGYSGDPVEAGRAPKGPPRTDK